MSQGEPTPLVDSLPATLRELAHAAARAPRPTRILGAAMLASPCAEPECPGCVARRTFGGELEAAILRHDDERRAAGGAA